MFDKKNNPDQKVSDALNKAIKKIKAKLKFQYYEVSPFKKIANDEVVQVVLLYVSQMTNYHHKIYILSALGKNELRSAIPYIVNTYNNFVNTHYSSAQDEIFIEYLFETIAKMNASEYLDSYNKLFQMKMTPAFGIFIKMLDKQKVLALTEVIYRLFKKENYIPKEWVGKKEEEKRYFVSYSILKYLVNRKDPKYRKLFEELIEEETYDWLQYSDSVYRDDIIESFTAKIKAVAKDGIEKLR